MGKKRKKKKPQNNLLVLNLLVLVVLVLILFEGRLIVTMFTHQSSSIAVTSDQAETEQKEVSGSTTPATELAVLASTENSIADAPLAGLGTGSVQANSNDTAAVSADTGMISEALDSFAVVPETEPPVDDSYFSDAVFIGDSRMMGFQNVSGITQGTFLTSVGLSLEGMSSSTIATADGNITVYQGLSGIQYKKIYLMLGTNDLGYYPWENFEAEFTNAVSQFHQLQPDAIIYICNVIYVEESKVTTSYINNENVRKINGYLLNICENLDYCYYLNLNEILSNGYGSLIDGASSDGVHLYETYCQQMLTYLKNHYISTTDAASTEDTEAASEANTEASEN